MDIVLYSAMLNLFDPMNRLSNKKQIEVNCKDLTIRGSHPLLTGCHSTAVVLVAVVNIVVVVLSTTLTWNYSLKFLVGSRIWNSVFPGLLLRILVPELYRKLRET